MVVNLMFLLPKLTCSEVETPGGREAEGSSPHLISAYNGLSFCHPRQGVSVAGGCPGGVFWGVTTVFGEQTPKTLAFLIPPHLRHRMTGVSALGACVPLGEQAQLLLGGRSEWGSPLLCDVTRDNPQKPDFLSPFCLREDRWPRGELGTGTRVTAHRRRSPDVLGPTAW